MIKCPWAQSLVKKKEKKKKRNRSKRLHGELTNLNGAEVSGDTF